MSAHHHHHHAQLPRAALYGACALVVFSIVAAAVGRYTGLGVTELPEGSAVAVRELRFDDTPGGAVAVYEAGVQTPVDRIAPGHDGFVRGVLRGFARARKLRGLDRDAHFVLTRWADGRLSMHDPQTGHVVALEAFGPDNAAAFARLMRAPGADRARADQNHLKGARTRHGGSHAADNG